MTTSSRLGGGEATKTTTDNEWLPDYCPKWCDGAHAVALAEGCSWEEAQIHHASGAGDFLPDLHNPISKRPTRAGGSGYDLVLRQAPRKNGGFLTPPLIILDIHDAADNRASADLTTGEARVLAAQLIHLADKADL